MSIKIKLLAVNVLLIASALVVAGVLYNTQKRINDLVTQVQKELEYLNIYKEMKIHLLNAAISVRNLIFDPQSQEAQEEINKNIQEFMNYLKILTERSKDLDKREAELTRNLAFFTYQGDLETVKQLIELEAYEEAQQTLVELEKEGFKDTINTLDELIEIRIQKIAREQQKMRDEMTKATYMTLGITIPSIAVISVILFFVSRGIIKNIEVLSKKVELLSSTMKFSGIKIERFKNELDRLVESLNTMIGDLGRAIGAIKSVMSNVAKGDLKVRLEGRFKGEVKDLADYINTSLKDLQEALLHVKEGLNTIVSSIESLRDHAESMERENENLNSSIASIMTSVDETSEAVRQISEETLRARNVSDDMQKSIRIGKQRINEMHESISKIVEVSQEINSITETIINIAEQTNLLALNAAIEAARAGELGRGFAVVADEVRRLAEISGNAAKEIAQLVEKAVRTVERGKGASEEVVNSYASIEEVTREIASIIDSIATAMEEQSRAIDIIRDNMAEITSVSEHGMSTVKGIVAEIRKITETAQEVRERMNQFKV